MKLGGFVNVIQLDGYVTSVRLEPKFMIPSGPGLAAISMFQREIGNQAGLLSLWMQDTLGLVVKMTHSVKLASHTQDQIPS